MQTYSGPEDLRAGMQHLTLQDSQWQGNTTQRVKPCEDQDMHEPAPTKHMSAHTPAPLTVTFDAASPHGSSAHALSRDPSSQMSSFKSAASPCPTAKSSLTLASRPSVMSPSEKCEQDAVSAQILEDALDTTAQSWLSHEFMKAVAALQLALKHGSLSISARFMLLVALADTILMAIINGCMPATNEVLAQAAQSYEEAIKAACTLEGSKISTLLPLCGLAMIYAMMRDQAQAKHYSTLAVEKLRAELLCLPQGGHRILLSLVELLGPLASGLIDEILGHCERQYLAYAQAVPNAWQLPGLQFQLMAQRLLARPLARLQGQELQQASKQAASQKQQLLAMAERLKEVSKNQAAGRLELVQPQVFSSKQQLQTPAGQVKTDGVQQALECVELDILASELLTLGLESDDKYTPQNIETTLLTQMASMDVEYLHSIVCHPPPSCAAVLAVAWMRLMRAQAV